MKRLILTVLSVVLVMQSPFALYATSDKEEEQFLDQDASEAEIKEAKEEYRELKARKSIATEDLGKALALYDEKYGGPVYFEKGSAVIKEDSYEVINVAAKVIKKYPRLNLRIEGHTDSKGDDVAKLILSEKRAKAVEDYLVKKKKISPERVTSIGFGASKPIANNKTWTGRQLNRRVEFHFYVP